MRAFGSVGRHAVLRRPRPRRPGDRRRGHRPTSTSSRATAPIIAGHAHPEVVEADPRRRRARAPRSGPRRRGRCGWPRPSASGCRRVEQVRHGQQRHRGDHERHPGGPRSHRPAQAVEVRRQLPRPQRRAAGLGRHRHGLARATRLGRGAPRARWPTPSVAPYNVVPTLDETYAAVIVEPVPPTWAWSPPSPGFLEGLRAECDRVGALLIFDEVITGFRVARGGAQERLGVTPDLSAFGKVIGGGLPVGAFGGRADVMDELAPLGPVYQAGTLSGNPLATAAGLAALDLLDDEAYAAHRVPGRVPGRRARRGLRDGGHHRRRAPRRSRCVGLHFGADAAYDYDVGVHDRRGALRRASSMPCSSAGVAIAPGAYEVMFPGLAHDDEVLDGHRRGRLGARRPWSPPDSPPVRRPGPVPTRRTRDRGPGPRARPRSTPTSSCCSARPATSRPRRSSRPSPPSRSGVDSGIPIVGVATSELTDDELRDRAEAAVEKAGRLRPRDVARLCASASPTSAATTASRAPSTRFARRSASASTRSSTWPSRRRCSTTSSRAWRRSG